MPIVAPYVAPIWAVVTFVFRYRLTVGILCFLVGCLFGDIHGRDLELAKSKAADLQAQVDKEKREAAIAADTAKDATARAAELDQENTALTKKVADYEAHLTGNACVIGDDVGRLLDIAGQPKAHRQSSQPLRAARPASGPRSSVARSPGRLP
jgi:hypothetical protein